MRVNFQENNNPKVEVKTRCLMTLIVLSTT